MKVETEMKLSKTCKHSLQFKPTSQQIAGETDGSRPKTLTAIYICNEAMKVLDCKKVLITIEAIAD